MRACKRGRRVGGSGGRSSPDAGEVFKKGLQISMKNLKVYKIFSRKFRDFIKSFLKFYRIFGENSDKILEICICRGLRAAAPTPANLWKSE